MHIKTLAVATFLIAGAATAAEAADLGAGSHKDAPAGDSSYSWTGFTIGAGVGAVNASTNGHVSETDGDATIYTPFAFNRDSVFINGELGYGNADKHLSGGVGGDIGVAFGHARLYGIMGMAWSHKTADPAASTGDAYFADFHVSGDPVGLVYGAGADFAFTHHWRTGVKYERVDWNGVNGSFRDGSVSTRSQAVEDRGLVQLIYAF